MVPDAPVKNTAGEKEIIHFSHLVNLRGCSADAAFERYNPRSLWSHQNQHSSAETHITPRPSPCLLRAARALQPQQQEHLLLTSLSQQISSFTTKLHLAENRAGKGQHWVLQLHYLLLGILFGKLCAAPIYISSTSTDISTWQITFSDGLSQRSTDDSHHRSFYPAMSSNFLTQNLSLLGLKKDHLCCFRGFSQC